MNLNNPNIEELKKLIRNCDDNNFNHIIWVSLNGEVLVNKFLSRNPSSEFVNNNETLLFWKGVLYSGNGYVGIDAASDLKYIENLFQELLFHWNSNFKGHIEN